MGSYSRATLDTVLCLPRAYPLVLPYPLVHLRTSVRITLPSAYPLVPPHPTYPLPYPLI